MSISESLSPSWYTDLAHQALDDTLPSRQDALRILTDPAVDLLSLLHAAYSVRLARHGKAVQVHVLNNAQNGACPEDCSYCTQAKTSEVDIHKYPIKSDDEVLEEARLAHESGAHRYCMVFAGRGPNDKRAATLARLTKLVKAQYPSLEICVSAGLLDQDKARTLADAGVDRLNHNLNTSRNHYPNICTTHTYDDRVSTLQAARDAGLNLCSGLIVGLGEPAEDLVELAYTLRDLQAESIPVNFLLPFDGAALDTSHIKPLTPEFCLRVLCLFRFVNPRAEVRCAAGREHHLRSLEVMCLYPANSLFLAGYLNAKGAERRRTLQMIKDAGFEIQADRSLDDVLQDDRDEDASMGTPCTINGTTLKGKSELRPGLRPEVREPAGSH